MSSKKIHNHIADAKARLLAQYRGKPRIEGLLEGLVQETQNVEDVLFDMYWKRSVNSAEGAQLDIIGNIVGQPRYGWSDAVYRTAILGKIGVNIAQGTPEDLIALFLLLMQCTKAHYIPIYPAECMIMGNFAPIDTEQLLVDGNMEASDTSAWTAVNDAILTKESDNPHGGLQCLQIGYNGTPDPGAQQFMLAVGEWYWVKGWFRTDVMGAHVGVLWNGATPIATLPPWTQFYKFDFIFQATEQTLILGSDLAAAGWVRYDSCSCRRMLVDNLQDVYEACLKVVPVGVKLTGIGWYEGDGHDGSWDGDGDDDEDEDGDEDPMGNAYFSFEGDPNGLGFGDLNDPTVGGKFASLFVW